MTTTDSEVKLLNNCYHFAVSEMISIDATENQEFSIADIVRQMEKALFKGENKIPEGAGFCLAQTYEDWALEDVLKEASSRAEALFNFVTSQINTVMVVNG